MPGEVSRSYGGPRDGRAPTWMEDQQTARDFLSWLIEDICNVHAEVSTARDEQLQQFVREGHLTFSFCAHGTNTYAINSKWLTSL